MGLWQTIKSWARGGGTQAVVAAADQAVPTYNAVGTDAPVALERAYGPSYVKRITVNEQRDGIRTPWVPVQPRWLPEDVDDAWTNAEQGNFRQVASLIEAMRADGTIAGLMRTRCSMVRLPTQFSGDPYLCRELQGVEPTYTPDGVLLDVGIPGVFKVMCPIPALIDLVFTGAMAGVAPAELVDDPVTGIPVLTPRDLHWLRYDWSVREWIYQGGAEPYVVKPGDGRWVLFTPESGPHARPWKTGAWLPCALAFVTKLAAVYDRLRWQAQLADPLKYFETEQELHEDHRLKLEDFLVNLWMRAPGIVLPAGVKAGVVETGGTGRGFDVYQQAEQWGDAQIAKALAGGQNVTSDGVGKGFGDGDIWSEIAENIIQATATSLGECITKQVIAPWARRKFPYRMSRNGDVAAAVAWDVRSPARRAHDAEVLGKLADSVTKANSVLAPSGQMVDAPLFFAQCGMTLPLVALPSTQPTALLVSGDESPARLAPAPTDAAPRMLPAGTGGQELLS